MQARPEDTFDQIFRDYGGRLQSDELESTSGMLDPPFIVSQLLHRARLVVHSFKSTYPHFFPKDIWIDIIRNPKFNAIATSRPDRDYVAFFSGMPIPLSYLFFDWLSHPDVLSDIGNAAVEKQQFTDLRTIPFWIPADEARREYCTKLLVHALDFIICHELQHLFLGHTDYLRVRFGHAEFPEIGMTRLQSLRPCDFRALEWDCDRAAIRTIYCTLRIDFEKGVHADTYATLDEALRGLMLSLSTVFSFMSFYESRLNSGCESTHPHPQTRCYLAATAVYEQALQDEDREGAEHIKNVFLSAHREAVSIWNGFRTCSFPIEYICCEDDIKQMYRDVIRLKKELKPYCRYCTDMPSDWRELIR